MLENSDDAAGPKKRAPAFRASRLKALVANVLTRAEALQQAEPALSDDERVLKLVGLALKLQGELKALSPARKAANDLGGKTRKEHDEALRQTLAHRIAGLGPPTSKPKPKPKGIKRASRRLGGLGKARSTGPAK